MKTFFLLFLLTLSIPAAPFSLEFIFKQKLLEDQTKKAREEAERADKDAAAAESELATENASLTVAEQEFAKFSTENIAARAQLRAFVTPINSRLLTLSFTADAMKKSHQELLNDSANIHSQVVNLNAALANMVSARGQTLINEQDRALLRVLQIAYNHLTAHPQYKDHHQASLQLVSHNGRDSEKRLQKYLYRAQQTLNIGAAVSGQSQTLQEELGRLTSEIQNAQIGIRNLSETSKVLEQKAKQ